MPGDPNKRVLLAVTGFHPQRWHELLSTRRDVVLEPDGEADPSIAYAVVWKQRPNILSRLPNLKAIFSIGAGVDHLFNDPGLPDVPIVRVVAPNLAQHMTEYVVWRVLDHHRQGALYRSQQPRKIWRDGRIVRANDSYASWARDVAREEDVPCIDLNELVAARYDELGPTVVNELFADEHTHTSRAGAALTASIVAGELARLKFGHSETLPGGAR
jgi:lysophospholipase L1-like esterase